MTAVLVLAAGGVLHGLTTGVMRADSSTGSSPVIEEFARALEDYFVFPEIGQRYAAVLRSNIAAGRYSNLRSPAALARAVTADVQAIYPDGHLGLHPPRARNRSSPSASSAESGVAHTGWLAAGIAYISFSHFPGNEVSVTETRQFLVSYASANTLVIDLRVHGGGFLEEMDVIFSHIFEEHTVLLHMDTRAAASRSTVPSPYLARVPGSDGVVRQLHSAIPTQSPSPLRGARIVVLTSGYTGSAAEHFALALRRTGRATLIGETTAGAGHFGRIMDLSGGYSAVVPVGRTFDPDTGEGWEGIGVQPHIEVRAERALYEALIRSGMDAREAARTARQFQPRGSMKRILPLRPRHAEVGVIAG